MNDVETKNLWEAIKRDVWDMPMLSIADAPIDRFGDEVHAVSMLVSARTCFRRNAEGMDIHDIGVDAVSAQGREDTPKSRLMEQRMAIWSL